MTFIAGFIEKDNIFLFADTAITEWDSNKKSIPPTSFGEASYSDDNKTIYQSEIKIFVFNNNLIIGGAGTSRSIDLFIENVETYSKYGFLPEKIIESAIENIEENDFELLIGYFLKGNPILLKKRDKSTELENCTKNVFSYVGVEGKHFKSFQTNFKELKVQTNSFEFWEPKKILVTINSILQGYGTWNYILEEGVGGVFTSVYLNKQGSIWQPSLGYILFDINFNSLKSMSSNPEMVLPNNLFTNSKYIFVDNREGAFYISSPKPNFTGFLFRELDIKKKDYMDKWFEKYEQELIEQFSNIEIEYLIFICTNTRVISIFEKTELDQKKIKIEYGESLKLKYEILNETDIVTFAEFINWISEPLDDELTIKT